jgi:polyferredoxin
MRPTQLAKLRRISQTLFLVLFFVHLFGTEYRGSLKGVSGDIRLPLPYPTIFLLSDPLVALCNALASRALYRGLLWSLIILIPTLFLGRFFCGWICPLGTLNHFFGSLKSEKKRGKTLLESNRYKNWQSIKYYVLVALLISAIFGGLTLTVLDPIALLERSLTVSILPGLNIALNAGLDYAFQTHNGVVGFFAQGLHWLLSATLLSFHQPHFRQGFFLGIVFIVLLALNLRVTRFWCRALCPLGALLGVVSRWSILGIEKTQSSCDECNRCELHCQGGDDPIPGVPWRKAECHLCFNCVSDCPTHGIAFKFFPGTATTRVAPQLQRRKLFTSLAAGLAALPLLRSTTSFSAEHNPRLIRPPGSLDESEFLARCIRCDACLKVCPNNALHPTLTEAGLEGLWSPMLVMRTGYCEPSCTLCGQVCPTGAIWEITSQQKAWVTAAANPNIKPIRLGTAFYDRGRCLPWAMATDCIVCEEWCPTSPKAIYLENVEVADPLGAMKQVRQPHIDPSRCVGCGACEFACPVKDSPAVYVTSIGESRSKTNQILLQRANKGSSA